MIVNITNPYISTTSGLQQFVQGFRKDYVFENNPFHFMFSSVYLSHHATVTTVNMKRARIVLISYFLFAWFIFILHIYVMFQHLNVTLDSLYTIVDIIFCILCTK